MVTQEELEKMSPEEVAQLQKSNCIFCKIIKGEIPSQKIYEDEHVVAILDIRPATKGHILVLPKEHYPILPVVPPDTFKAMFRNVKLLSKAIKKAYMVNDVTVFIANGGVAGQQAPHFLFHIIPREKGDKLKNFDIIPNDSFIESQKQVAESLKNNVNIMMSNHLKREGIDFSKMPAKEDELNTNKQDKTNDSKNNQTLITPVPISPENIDQKKEQIATIIQDNADVRNMLRNDPEGFKTLIEENAELKNIFQAVDINALSHKLQSMPEEKSDNQNLKNDANNTLTNTQEIKNENNQNHNSTINTKEIVEKKMIESNNNPENNEEKNNEEEKIKPQVFLGENPLEQRDTIFAYLEEKPKAKELLLENPKRFIELLQNRPDVQSVFKDVNIKMLSFKLNEREKQQQQLNETVEDDNCSNGNEHSSNTNGLNSITAKNNNDNSNNKNSNNKNSNNKNNYNNDSSNVSLQNQAPKPQVFLGENPLEQRDTVFAYLEEKPKAKELLLENPKRFIELLQTRPDVQSVFKDVNIKMLSFKLNEREQQINNSGDANE